MFWIMHWLMEFSNPLPIAIVHEVDPTMLGESLAVLSKYFAAYLLCYSIETNYCDILPYCRTTS